MTLIQKPNQYLLKLLIIGDSGVGKTNILLKFSENKFKINYIATIGVDFKVKTIDIDGNRLKLQIWDTAGQQRYKNIAQNYYKGAAAIILTYSITQSNTFDNIEKWLKQILQHVQDDTTMILVGNKIDLEEDRVVQTLQGRALANKHNLQFIEVSAKTGQNINNIFQQLGQILVKNKIDKFKKQNANYELKSAMTNDTTINNKLQKKNISNCKC